MNRLPDEVRLRRVREALAGAGLDGVVCALPENVLLLSGYWPVIGNALALANREGRVSVVVPEDEGHLAEDSWADEIRQFRPVSLDHTGSAAEAVRVLLAEATEAMGLRRGRVGYEAGPFSQPAPYAARFFYFYCIEAEGSGSCFPGIVCDNRNVFIMIQ